MLLSRFSNTNGLSRTHHARNTLSSPSRVGPRPFSSSGRSARTVMRSQLEGVMTKEDKLKMERVIERFRMADVDGNGTIDREELRHLLESVENGEVYLLSQHWLPDEELDRVMALYDTNKDGVISQEEFKQIVYDGILLDGTLAEYEAAFRTVDKSGNGTIGATELGQLFAQMGNPISMEALVDIMQTYDKDDSGQIEFGEFLLMFRNQMLDLAQMRAYMNGDMALDGSGALVEPVEGDMTLIFSNQELDELIAAQPDKLVVVYGALTWCRPCKAMQRPVQKLAEHYKDQAVFVKLFGNANKQTKTMFKERFQIRSTPCFITLRGGQPVFTQTGTNKEKLEAGLRSLMKDPPAKAIYPSAVAATAL